MKPSVIVSRGEDPFKTTQQVLTKLTFPDLSCKKILIKPNAARLASPGEGVTTHPEVVRAVIRFLKEKGTDRIAIGESCIFGVDSQEAFEKTGMKGVSEKEGVELIDLDQTDPTELAVPEGKLVKKIKISAILKEFDLIVSVPVMKTHMHTRVTLSVKNMKGLLWRREKVKLHHLRADQSVTKGFKELDIAISEMATALAPDFAVIDATTGMEGMGPAYGRSKRTEMVIAGQNPFSTDAVAARLMGIDPNEVPHLRLSAEKGLGEIDIDQISVEPRDFLKWGSSFDPPPSQLSIPFPGIAVHDMGSCSACLSTLLVFLQEYHLQLTDYRLKDDKVHVAIGKNLTGCPKGTILIGNCASKLKKEGIFIQGCPPVGSQIWETLAKKKR